MLMKTLASSSFLFSTCSSSNDQCLFHRIAGFFHGFAARTASGSHSSKDLLDTPGSKIASLSTPNGPWVYTVVPWED